MYEDFEPGETPCPMTIVTDESLYFRTACKLVGLGYGTALGLIHQHGLWKGEEGRQILVLTDEAAEEDERPLNHFATEIIRPVDPIRGNALILTGPARFLRPRKSLDEILDDI